MEWGLLVGIHLHLWQAKVDNCTAIQEPEPDKTVIDLAKLNIKTVQQLLFKCKENNQRSPSVISSFTALPSFHL